MEIDLLKSTIEEKLKRKIEIVSIFRTGSSLFCENCKDFDFNVIVKENIPSFKIYDKETRTDYFIESEQNRNNRLNCILSLSFPIRYIIDECFKKTSTIYGDNSINIDLINNANKYKQAVKQELARGCFHPNVNWKDSEKYCHKHLWWVILGLMFIENKSYEVTYEMRNIIQKCHDGVLDKYWETWVKERL